MLDGKIIIEKLICYARTFLYLSAMDEIYTRNILLKEFNLKEPYEDDLDLAFIKELTVPDSLLEELCDYAIQKNIIDEYEKANYSSYIMGILSPKPSEVNTVFKDLKEKMNIDTACNYLYNLSIKNNYIQKTAIDKNLKWEAIDGDNNLEITINLSKPEKDNKEIAKLLTASKNSNYPKCLLCKENEGYEGTLKHPARVNLRSISLKLGEEDWFVQYSPYLYYDEHCIAISKNHIPMKVNGNTLIKLFDFIDYFPNYFIGSNASLPIVGGSILNHEHFQGGKHTMPMHKAANLKSFNSIEFPQVEISIINWYNSALRLVSVNRQDIIDLGTKIIDEWSNYNDENCDIISQSENTMHNAVTPIARLTDKGKYCLELILRNNRTNEQYPDGIFHSHKEYHNIKKEGIGIIEVMGLFILPGRLKKQMNDIANILASTINYDITKLNNPDNSLYIHRNMVMELINKYGTIKDPKKALEIVRQYINETCIKVLECTAVFKNDEKGQASFCKFISSLQLK
jgi:UDPglucose--hexose-1-phosphate uridylyltransferase